VAITIRNKETEELIRRIGRRTGEGPSAVVRRLVEREASGSDETASADEIERRLKVFDDLAKAYPPPQTNPTSREIAEEVDAIYEYLDEDSGVGGRRNTA
jgi:hypothetical protein